MTDRTHTQPPLSDGTAPCSSGSPTGRWAVPAPAGPRPGARGPRGAAPARAPGARPSRAARRPRPGDGRHPLAHWRLRRRLPLGRSAAALAGAVADTSPRWCRTGLGQAAGRRAGGGPGEGNRRPRPAPPVDRGCPARGRRRRPLPRLGCPTFGWRETGSAARHARRSRSRRRCFYEHMGHRIADTILPARRGPPEGLRMVRRDGLDIALSHDPAHGGHDIAVFERGGRTCVIAGTSSGSRPS